MRSPSSDLQLAAVSTAATQHNEAYFSQEFSSFKSKSNSHSYNIFFLSVFCPAVPGAQPNVHALPSPRAAHQSGSTAGGARETRRVWLQTGRRAVADGPQQHQLYLFPKSGVWASQRVWSSGAQTWITYYPEGRAHQNWLVMCNIWEANTVCVLTCRGGTFSRQPVVEMGSWTIQFWSVRSPAC